MKQSLLEISVTGWLLRTGLSARWMRSNPLAMLHMQGLLHHGWWRGINALWPQMLQNAEMWNVNKNNPSHLTIKIIIWTSQFVLTRVYNSRNVQGFITIGMCNSIWFLLPYFSSIVIASLKSKAIQKGCYFELLITLSASNLCFTGWLEWLYSRASAYLDLAEGRRFESGRSPFFSYPQTN